MFNQIGEFIVKNAALIVAIVIAIIVIWRVGYLVVNRKWDQLRAEAYKAMLLAERTITGYKKGAERFQQVLQGIYGKVVPIWLQPFITLEMVQIQLQDWYYDIKDFLDNMKKDNSADGLGKPKDAAVAGIADKPPDISGQKKSKRQPVKQEAVDEKTPIRPYL